MPQESDTTLGTVAPSAVLLAELIAQSPHYRGHARVLPNSESITREVKAMDAHRTVSHFFSANSFRCRWCCTFSNSSRVGRDTGQVRNSIKCVTIVHLLDLLLEVHQVV